MPGTCAPSTADKIPLERASALNSFAGSTTPENVVMWLKKITRVRGVMASLKRLRTCAASLTGRGKSDFFHHDAVALGLEVPGVLASRVLLVGHQHLVARFQVEPVRDVAVGFGGITHQGDLVAMASDKLGERIAKLVPGRIPPYRIVLGILLVHFLGREVAVENSSQDRQGAGADSSVVEINFALRDKKLFTHLGPVRILILVEKRSVGEWREFLHLGQRVPAEGPGG